MTYNSPHTGPEIDAAVQMLGQVQDARDSTSRDLAEVKALSTQVDGQASQVSSQAAAVIAKASQVEQHAAAVEQARAESTAASAIAVDSKDAAVLAAEAAQASREAAIASEQAASQSQLAAGLSEQIVVETAALTQELVPQIAADSAAARTAADRAARSAADAVAVVTGGTAALVPEPGKIPLATGQGTIHAQWLGPEIARTDSVQAVTEAVSAAAVAVDDFGNSEDPAKGAALVPYDGENVADILGQGRPLLNYDALRGYAGRASIVRITQPEMAGTFVADLSDQATTDDNATVIVSSNGTRWRRVYDGDVQAKWFGYDGREIGAAVNAACRVSAALGGGAVYIGQGWFTTNQEIKIPSFVEVAGAGINATKITASAYLSVTQNVFTNTKNNRWSRSDYDELMTIRDLTVDGNAAVRDPTGTSPTDDQGSGIKFSCVRNSSILRVRAINCPLHCIDVMASTYLNDGNINHQPMGPSLDILIENCIASNPQRDDGITTHNSGRIRITGCKAFFDGTPGDVQQGIEIDEGSWDVTVSECYAKNFQKGFQAKGHEGTIPAVDVRFVRCTAEDCTYSFEASHIQVGTVLPAGQVYWARNITFEDCVSINPKPSAVYATAKDLSINGYIGVTVKNFTVYGTLALITIDKGADDVHIKGVKFVHGSILVGTATGRIHAYTPAPAVTNGQTISIEDVRCEVAMAAPLIRCSSGAAKKNIRNIKGIGSDNTVPMMYINVNSNDEISALSQVGYAGAMQIASNSMILDNSIRLDPGLRYSLSGGASPEGVVTAPVCTTYSSTGSGAIFRKSNASGNTGWVAM